MISRTKRFTTKRFDQVFRRGQRIRLGSYLFIANPSRFGGHFSVVVGKKTAKSAVKRNRIRRQIYEIFRNHLQEKITTTDLIFLYNGSEVFENTNEFQKALTSLISKFSH